MQINAVTQYRTDSGTHLLDLKPNGDISVLCYTVPANEVHELASAAAHAAQLSARITAQALLPLKDTKPPEPKN